MLTDSQTPSSPPRDRAAFLRSRIGLLILAALSLAIIVSGVAYALAQRAAPSSPSATSSALVDPGTSLHGVAAPNFTLTNQFGQPMSLAQFRGKVVVMAFTDSQCTTICPLTSQSLLQTLKLLGPDGASQVQLLGIDANPEAISQQDVQTYSAAHGLENHWFFLTGSNAQLEQVWKEYNIYVQITQGAIDHTPAVFVIDPQGREQTLFLTSGQYGVVSLESEAIAHAVAPLLPHHVQVASAAPAQPDLSTAKVVDLPRLTADGTSGTVALGPGQAGTARLTFFYASWTDSAAQDLQTLDQVAPALSSSSTQVQVTAVDIGSVEPAVAPEQQTLQQAGTLSHLTVALDPTGAVTDAYGVQDVPWFTLTGADGKVLWTHDGWLDPASLTAAVQQHSASAAK